MFNNLWTIEKPSSEYERLIKTAEKYYYHHYPNKKTLKTTGEMSLINWEDGHLSLANTP